MSELGNESPDTGEWVWRQGVRKAVPVQERAGLLCFSFSFLTAAKAAISANPPAKALLGTSRTRLWRALQITWTRAVAMRGRGACGEHRSSTGL